ncbi:MAG: DNA-methyltransferase [Candidatus Heimdallarchaeaceae archaeon]
MTKTSHKIHYQNSQDMGSIRDESVDLTVTSSPYPMIQIWDGVFSEMNPEIEKALKEENGNLAFELMHQELDKVWDEVYRVLKTNGIACINIGDATRSIGNDFKLFASHSRIINHCCKIGFQCLPLIIWTKLTNAPNKFMGSGMLPPGGYVTLEHEYILILRKGGKRAFTTDEEKKERLKSSYFWEERNKWFSDIWDLKGVHQALNDNNLRKRSAAYPFELAYRLISMYSLKGDTVLDPFLGTGTTMLAAMSLERNSVNIEIDENFKEMIDQRVSEIKEHANEFNSSRIQDHINFIKDYSEKYEKPPYENEIYGFPVKTKQEIVFKLRKLEEVREIDASLYQVIYE